ncbi:MAG: MaoC/PaaZ C-terminal domain-containing protein [Deltaproteobacteria bacterium]
MAKEISYEDIKVGDTVFEFISDPITRTHLARYAGASGDFNPLHHDETFVAVFGMPRVIVQGMLVMGITGRAITDWVAQKHLRAFKVRFAGMTEPVDFNQMEATKNRATLKVIGRAARKFVEGEEKRIECEIETTDVDGAVKLTGSFIVAFP